MRDATAVWLDPIMEAISHAEPDEVPGLIMQSSMPVIEADDRTMEAVIAMRDAAPKPEEYAGMTSPLEGRCIDWVRFGQLCIERLGWTDSYPWEPAP